MAFDGNGNWVSNFSAEADRDAGYKILASRFDNIFIADIAQSFENCLTKDAQVKPTQAFDANNYKVINVGNPTNNNDAVNLYTLDSKDATAVHKSGNETIAGIKTFSDTIDGNALTATTLQTARTINGTSFNGSANITTSSWGTARNVSISDADATNTGSAVSVNGSGDITLKLPSTIKANLSGNATQDGNGNNIVSTYATKTELNQRVVLNLFHNDWFDYEINDQSWLRADTFSWNDGTVYTEAYNHLVDDIDDVNSTTETVGSYTITYYPASDGHKIILPAQETTASNIYTESGVAWYYILDTVNKRFKLPRMNPARAKALQTLKAKGNGIAVGLTNGTTDTGLCQINTSSICLTNKADLLGASVTSTVPSTGTYQQGVIGITTDSAKSGIIADITDAVSTYSGNGYHYFYVGQFSRSATEQTAGLNATLFNAKADVDLGNAAQNASATAKQTIVGWSNPDYSFAISLSSSSFPYTAPKDGYINVSLSAKNGYAYLYINSVQVGYAHSTNDSYYSMISGQYKVSAGDIISYSTWSSGFQFASFFPVKG